MTDIDADRDDGHSDLARLLADFARDDLSGPVEEMGGMIAAMLRDAERSGVEGYGDDLARLGTASAHLLAITGRLSDPGAPLSDDDASIRTIRHDLRTPITSILGYGELVAEDAVENGDAWLAEALADILLGATRLLKIIDNLSSLADGPSPSRRRLLEAPSSTEPAAASIAAARPAEGHGAIGGRILVVDDNGSMRDLTSRRLRRQGHRVSVCDSGEAALELTADGGFDLLMLDLMMPGMDGIEVLERLRDRPASRAIPVIVMSALDDLGSAVKCIEAGADDYLSKPLDETLLRARIGSSLERKFLRDREQETLRRLESEQRRSDALLHNILPVSVVKRLRAGETVIADHFDDVTVLFCDLVGFTSLSARLEPAGTLDLLEEIFSGFDALADANGIEKVKTIGDAYMVVGGISDPVENHARRVAAMARAMPGIVTSSRQGRFLDVRIGIHTGPAAGGIVGTKKFFYDVWGDTVNTASRLEEACQPGRIHVSQAVMNAIGDGFGFEKRRPVDIQGKGRMQTFYLKH